MEGYTINIIKATIDNFASYEHLEFTFNNRGLTLVQGPTGSGKSTLCDIVPWILYAVTAKGGSVSDVISWPGGAVVRGALTLMVGSDVILVCRSRGAPKDNDLYFTVNQGPIVRGKDLNDTQKLLNAAIKINSDLYLAGSYFHEFSPTAQFFTTTAKNRRAMSEQLVDLSLAKQLQEKTTEQKKSIQKLVQQSVQSKAILEDRVKRLSAPNDYQERSDNFTQDNKIAVSNLSAQISQLSKNIKTKKYFKDGFQDLSEAMSQLKAEVCSECGQRKNSDKIAELTKLINDLRIEELTNSNNITTMQRKIDEIETIKTSKNIYLELLQSNIYELQSSRSKLDEEIAKLAKLAEDVGDLDLLLEIINDLRGLTIKNTIQNLETNTNSLLAKHFDAELKVLFSVVDADKLDVEIIKDGNICGYSQLSKGQRQLVKLCFGVSVMLSVANHNGISFNSVFLDECLDGLSDEFKIKTYGLLQTLGQSYENIFVVEHSESLKSMFTNQISVELVNGKSILNE